MATRYVLDGSNLAHDGASGGKPSFDRLMAAVASLKKRHTDAEISVCVDANLKEHLTPGDRAQYVQADRRREVWAAPAGTVGRGDTWVLAVAKLARAQGDSVTVVSNDSFAENHAEHKWLFDEGSLLGGRCVDGVGWVWVPRYPVISRGRPATASRTVNELKPVEIEPELPVTVVVAGNDGEADLTEEVIPEAEPESHSDLPDLATLPQAGSIVEARVTGFPAKDYGVFVMADAKFFGRVTNTYFAEEDSKKRGSEVYDIGDVVFARVLGITPTGTLKLSIRDALSAPDEEQVDGQLEIYGLAVDYDENGNYVTPVGYSHELNDWMDGFEYEREKWQANADMAYFKWQKHIKWLDDRVPDKFSEEDPRDPYWDEQP